MKKIIFVACIAASFGIAACHSSANEKEQETVFQSGPPKDSIKKHFSHVVFATKKDTSRGMPLSAGLEDTLHFHDKVYGFCSKECKEAFLAILKKEKKL